MDFGNKYISPGSPDVSQIYPFDLKQPSNEFVNFAVQDTKKSSLSETDPDVSTNILFIEKGLTSFPTNNNQNAPYTNLNEELPGYVLYIKEDDSQLRMINTYDALSEHLVRATSNKIQDDYETKVCMLDILNTPLKHIAHHTNMGEFLRHLYTTDLLMDVKIEINKELMMAHRIALSCFSNYFANLFYNNKQVKFPLSLKIVGVSPEAFALFLKFVYTGELTFTPTTVPDLLLIADSFQVSALQQRRHLLLENLPLEQMIRMIVKYRQSLSVSLYEKFVEQITRLFCEAVFTKYFVQIDIGTLQRILASDDLIVHSEFQVFKFANDWLVFDFNQRAKYAEKVLNLVRYSFMSQYELFRCVEILCPALVRGNERYQNILTRANWILTASILGRKEPFGYTVYPPRKCYKLGFCENTTTNVPLLENIVKTEEMPLQPSLSVPPAQPASQAPSVPPTPPAQPMPSTKIWQLVQSAQRKPQVKPGPQMPPVPPAPTVQPVPLALHVQSPSKAPVAPHVSEARPVPPVPPILPMTSAPQVPPASQVPPPPPPPPAAQQVQYSPTAPSVPKAPLVPTTPPAKQDPPLPPALLVPQAPSPPPEPLVLPVPQTPSPPPEPLVLPVPQTPSPPPEPLVLPVPQTPSPPPEPLVLQKSQTPSSPLPPPVLPMAKVSQAPTPPTPLPVLPVAKASQSPSMPPPSQRPQALQEPPPLSPPSPLPVPQATSESSVSPAPGTLCFPIRPITKTSFPVSSLSTNTSPLSPSYKPINKPVGKPIKNPGYLQRISFPTPKSVDILVVGEFPSCQDSMSLSETSAENQWVSYCELPEPMQQHAVALMTGKLYLLGGFNPTIQEEIVPTRQVFSITIGNNTWKRRADMIEARYNHCACELDRNIYAIGGLGLNNRVLSSVECYIPHVDMWAYVHFMNVPRYAATAACLDGKLYVVGGLGEDTESMKPNPVLHDVEVYDPEENSWDFKKGLRFPRCNASLVNVDDMLYLCGGATKSNDEENQKLVSVSAIDEYEECRDDWVHRTNMHIPRHDAGVVVAGSCIYIIGGYSSITQEILKSIECFDTRQHVWLPGLQELPLPSHHIGCASMVSEWYKMDPNDLLDTLTLL